MRSEQIEDMLSDKRPELCALRRIVIHLLRYSRIEMVK